MRAATGGSLSASPSLVSGLMGRASGRSSPSAFSQPVGPGSPDFQTKILHMAWHPQEHVLAAAASNSLYIFNA
jgi:serine/threonine-protein phosphatase 2A regulatory subunit B